MILAAQQVTRSFANHTHFVLFLITFLCIVPELSLQGLNYQSNSQLPWVPGPSRGPASGVLSQCPGECTKHRFLFDLGPVSGWAVHLSHD